MNEITNLLAEYILRAKKVAVLGCGSPLRGDDAAGTEIALRLADLDGQARAYPGDVAPENLTGEIKAFAPDLLIVIDALDLNADPGKVIPVDKTDIGGVSFSTHMLPLNIVIDYLIQETGCEVLLLGIQAAQLEFMSEMTPAVSDTVDELTTVLRNLLARD
jgi:hydrogenase maturation protease HycI